MGGPFLMSQHPSRDVATARPVQPWTGLSRPNGLTIPSMQPARREIKPSARVGNVSVWVLVGAGYRAGLFDTTRSVVGSAGICRPCASMKQRMRSRVEPRPSSVLSPWDPSGNGSAHPSMLGRWIIEACPCPAAC